MAQVAPILAGTTLANPDANGGYSESFLYRGADTEMADGSISTDLIYTTDKRMFTLHWSALTTVEKTALENAFAAAKFSSVGVAFTSPANIAYTVTRAKDFMEIVFESFLIAGGSLRWRAELRLRES